MPVVCHSHTLAANTEVRKHVARCRVHVGMQQKPALSLAGTVPYLHDHALDRSRRLVVRRRECARLHAPQGNPMPA